jgi:hypothetical protein
VAKIDYEKYLIRKPGYESAPGTKNRQSPGMTVMSEAQIPESNVYIELGWIYGIPDPNPGNFEMINTDYDEIILHWSGDPWSPHDLGADLLFYVGGQACLLNTTSAVFVPKGLEHGPLIWKKWRHPHIQMSIVPGTGDPRKAFGVSNLKAKKNELPVKNSKEDFEKYVVRSPIWESGPGLKNRQSPSMTYMSRLQVQEANYYIEMGWIYGIPEPNPIVREHTHNFDEIILHIGSDPKNPEDLGGEIEIGVGGQPMTFNTSSSLFIPRGLKHGPLTWKKFSRPHLEMTMMLGGGTKEEGWGKDGVGPLKK